MSTEFENFGNGNETGYNDIKPSLSSVLDTLLKGKSDVKNLAPNIKGPKLITDYELYAKVYPYIESRDYMYCIKQRLLNETHFLCKAL